MSVYLGVKKRVFRTVRDLCDHTEGEDGTEVGLGSEPRVSYPDTSGGRGRSTRTSRGFGLSDWLREGSTSWLRTRTVSPSRFVTGVDCQVEVEFPLWSVRHEVDSVRISSGRGVVTK